MLNYEVNNKTASDLGVLAFRQSAYNTPPFYRNVPPMSKAVIIIPVRTVPASGNIRIEFMFRLHADWMDRIDHTFNPAILDGRHAHDTAISAMTFRETIRDWDALREIFPA